MKKIILTAITLAVIISSCNHYHNNSKIIKESRWVKKAKIFRSKINYSMKMPTIQIKVLLKLKRKRIKKIMARMSHQKQLHFRFLLKLAFFLASCEHSQQW